MLKLRQIVEDDLINVHKIAFTQQNPEWAKYNAPYFNEYKQMDYKTFLKEEKDFFLREPYTTGIFIDHEFIGTITHHWIDRNTQWLEMGIVIYSEDHWGEGIGKRSMTQYFDTLFQMYPLLEHIGLTTWSGNERMMNLAKSLKMKEEACIRKVRYYNNIYYDSLKYGILREEFYQEKEH